MVYVLQLLNQESIYQTWHVFCKHFLFPKWQRCKRQIQNLKNCNYWWLPNFLAQVSEVVPWNNMEKNAENQIPMLAGEKCITQRCMINQIILGREDKLKTSLSKNSDLWNDLTGRRIKDSLWSLFYRSCRVYHIWGWVIMI